MSGACSRERRGYTIRDLMVVIAVVGLGLAMVPPLLTSSCGHGRRTQCFNNVRNLGFALQSYLNQKNRLPNATTWGEDPRALATGDASKSIIASFNRPDFGMFRPAEMAGAPTDVGPLRSWVVDILPGIDMQGLDNAFERDRVYFDDGGPGGNPSRPTNALIGQTDIAILRCPNDDTVFLGAGNLSYAANMGFALWQGDGIQGQSWEPNRRGGRPAGFRWGTAKQGGGMEAFRKTAVMFQGTAGGGAPWDLFHRPATITDGLATTVLIAENVLGGASPNDPATGAKVPLNWAAAHPRFVGFIGSGAICEAKGVFDCSRSGRDGRVGPNWARANPIGTMSAINAGARQGMPEGTSPFANSLHPGGIVVGMCDGSTRFLTDDIDGAVWARLLTPAGESRPWAYRQPAIDATLLTDD